MEEVKKNQHIDIFVEKYLKEIKLESPSDDFTTTIMDAISVINIEKNKVIYKPLISKKGWLLIGIILVGILAIPLKGIESKWLTFPKLNFSFLENISIDGLFAEFTVSNIVLYACVLFGIFVSIQFIYLKGYFEKQLSL